MSKAEYTIQCSFPGCTAYSGSEFCPSHRKPCHVCGKAPTVAGYCAIHPGLEFDYTQSAATLTVSGFTLLGFVAITLLIVMPTPYSLGVLPLAVLAGFAIVWFVRYEVRMGKSIDIKYLLRRRHVEWSDVRSVFRQDSQFYRWGKHATSEVDAVLELNNGRKLRVTIPDGLSPEEVFRVLDRLVTAEQMLAGRNSIVKEQELSRRYGADWRLDMWMMACLGAAGMLVACIRCVQLRLAQRLETSSLVAGSVLFLGGLVFVFIARSRAKSASEHQTQGKEVVGFLRKACVLLGLAFVFMAAAFSVGVLFDAYDNR